MKQVMEDGEAIEDGPLGPDGLDEPFDGFGEGD